MASEIERKYLLSALPAGLDRRTRILQGYLSTGDPEVRVRSKGEKYFVTRKGGEGLVREEEEAEISSDAFGILWPATSGARVEKIRYEFAGSDGLTWEIDEYQGVLCGLFTAEVELPTEGTDFVVPPVIKAVCVRDVTREKSYKNKALASNGFPACEGA